MVPNLFVNNLSQKEIGYSMDGPFFLQYLQLRCGRQQRVWTSNNCEAKSPFCLVLVCQLYVDRTRPLIRFNKVIDLLRRCRQGVVEPSCSPIPPFYDASGSESLRLRIGMGRRGLFNRRTHRRKKDAPGFTTSQMHLTCVWDGSRSCVASSTSWHLNISIFMNLRSAHLLYFITTYQEGIVKSSLLWSQIQ